MTWVLTFVLLGFQRIKFSYSFTMRGLEDSLSNLTIICALAKIFNKLHKYAHAGQKWRD